MPELPEVETTRRGLAAALEGRRLIEVIARRPKLRFPLPVDFATRLEGRSIVSIARRAKFLLFSLDDDQILIAHLGMSGRFKIFSGDDIPVPDRHDHILMRHGNGGEVRYHDPRRFGFMDLTTQNELGDHRMLAGLGPEPLDPAFDGPVLAARLAGRRGPIKTALLDQKIVAGLGNIYVCEALHRSGISPRRRAGTIAGRRAARLAAAIHDVLERAIAAGGSSLRDFQHTDGKLGYFQTEFAVYGRAGETCPTCDGAPIKRLVQGGRSTFYCSRCQH